MQPRDSRAPMTAFCLKNTGKAFTVHLHSRNQFSSNIWLSALFSGQIQDKVTGKQNGHYLTTVKYAISRMKDRSPIMPKYYQKR
jgi:hypothetical protein